MAYYFVIACEVLMREVCYECALSPNRIDLVFNKFGLHDVGKDKMRVELQALIDGIKSRDYDAILMGYGLCNNGLAGLTARDIPIVVPRAHDCITLLLGSKERYKIEFNREPGTQYDSPGWMEHHHPEEGEDHVLRKLGIGMPYDEMVARYGEENAKYLQEEMPGLSQHKTLYSRRVYIDTGLGPRDELIAQSRKQAEEDGWTFEVVEGDRALVRKMLSGEWDGDKFIVLRPGHILKPTYDDLVIDRDCPAG